MRLQQNTVLMLARKHHNRHFVHNNNYVVTTHTQWTHNLQATASCRETVDNIEILYSLTNANVEKFVGFNTTQLCQHVVSLIYTHYTQHNTCWDRHTANKLCHIIVECRPKPKQHNTTLFDTWHTWQIADINNTPFVFICMTNLQNCCGNFMYMMWIC